MSRRADAAREAIGMERARPSCTAVPWELQGGWGVAVVERTRRGERRMTGPAAEVWEWLRQAPAGEAPPPSSPAGRGEDGR